MTQLCSLKNISYLKNLKIFSTNYRIAYSVGWIFSKSNRFAVSILYAVARNHKYVCG